MKKRIVVIFGGHSTEYDVSLQSAFSVLQNINRKHFEIVPVGITRDGEWYHYTGKIENISTTGIHVDILPQENDNVPVAEEMPAAIQAAVPEDVKEVIKNWNSILSQFGRSGQTMLEGVKKSVSESGELLLVFADLVSEGYFKQDDSRQLEALKTVISNVTGKDVNIKTMVSEEKTDNAFVDLSLLIHFEDVEYK